MNEKNETDDRDDDLFNDDPTDELPVLNLAEYKASGPVPTLTECVELPADADEDHADTVSLNAIEADIHSLQSRWASFENALRARDVENDELRAELEERQAALKSLNDDLGALAKERTTLLETLAAAGEERASVEAELNQRDEAQRQHDQKVLDRERKLERAEKRYEKLQQEAENLNTQLQDQTALTEEAVGKAASLSESNAPLREIIQDLEAYIDRRKRAWGELQSDIDGLGEKLRDAEATLEAKDAEIHRHESEESRLAASINDLEQQRAELDGRRAERETANAELQEKLVANARTIEQLTAEAQEAANAKADLTSQIDKLEDDLSCTQADLLAARERIEELEVGLASAETGLDERRAEAHELSKRFDDQIEEQAGRINELSDTLESERAALEAARTQIAELEAQQAKADNRNLELERKLESNQVDREELQARLANMDEAAQRSADEIDSYVEKLAHVDTALERRDEQVAERQTELDEALARIDAMAADLESRTASITELENELRAQQETSAALGREVQRIDALYATVQALGTRISKNLSSEAQQRKADVPAGERSGDVQPTTRLIVTYKDDEAIRFALHKDDMTIGRSADSDIQLNWQSISRHHARISSDGETTFIEDLGSKNGVYVNSKAVTSHELHDGDTVGIGAVQFRFVDLSELAGMAGTRH